MTDANETVGTILDDSSDLGQRDAIHVAVITAVAGEVLDPRDDVGFHRDGTAIKTKNVTEIKPIGIVDPFLETCVDKGEKFWILIYPRQIKGLRHVWIHPYLPDETPIAKEPNPNDISRSESYIRELADDFGLSYQALLDATDDFVENGKYFIGSEGSWVPDEFWGHYERITGKAIPSKKRQSFFTCAC